MQAYSSDGRVVLNLKQIMDERKLRIIDVARLADLSRVTVLKLRDNRVASIRLNTLAKLCTALQVGPGVLLRHIPASSLAAHWSGSPESLNTAIGKKP